VYLFEEILRLAQVLPQPQVLAIKSLAVILAAEPPVRASSDLFAGSLFQHLLDATSARGRRTQPSQIMRLSDCVIHALPKYQQSDRRYRICDYLKSALRWQANVRVRRRRSAPFVAAVSQAAV